MKTYYSTLIILTLLFVSCSKNNSTAPTNNPPANPANIVVTSLDSKIQLSWDSVADATKYDIYYSESSVYTKSLAQKIPGVTSPYTIDNLINGHTYYFAVVSSNSGGESGLGTLVPGTPQSILTGNWKGSTDTTQPKYYTFDLNLSVLGTNINGTGTYSEHEGGVTVKTDVTVSGPYNAPSVTLNFQPAYTKNKIMGSLGVTGTRINGTYFNNTDTYQVLLSKGN